MRDVLQAKSSEVPRLARAERGEGHREEILEIYASCKGNLAPLLHELLVEKGATLSYQALTAFCRRHGIGREPKTQAGCYHFGPGEEMQHDTSPHVVELDGRAVNAQTASLVVAHSEMLFSFRSIRTSTGSRASCFSLKPCASSVARQHAA